MIRDFEWKIAQKNPTSHCLVLSCSDIQDSRYLLVPPCTEKSMKSLETVQGCLYKNIPAYTSTCWYIPNSTISYLYILICSAMFWYILVCSSTYRVNHCIYKYILVCTESYLFYPGLKKGANQIRISDLLHMHLSPCLQ